MDIAFVFCKPLTIYEPFLFLFVNFFIFFFLILPFPSCVVSHGSYWLVVRFDRCL